MMRVKHASLWLLLGSDTIGAVLFAQRAADGATLLSRSEYLTAHLGTPLVALNVRTRL